MSSIYFPERQTSAEDHLSWWSQVPVPDQLLQRVAADYPNARNRTIKNIVGEFQGPEREPGWSDAEYQARWSEAVESHNAKIYDWQAYIPEEPDRFALRDAVRMHLAHTYSYTLPEDEAQRFADTEVEVGGIKGTPGAISTYFALPGFAARNPTAFTQLPDESATLRAEIAQLRSDLAEQVESSARHTEMLLRSRLAEVGYTPEQAEQLIAGEQITSKQVSTRKAHKEWRKRG